MSQEVNRPKTHFARSFKNEILRGPITDLMQKPQAALGHVSLPLLGYLSVNIMPETLHIHLSTYHRRYKRDSALRHWVFVGKHFDMA